MNKLTLIAFIAAVNLACATAAVNTSGISVNERGPVEMVLIKGGTFEMGVNGGEFDEGPVHKVTLSDFFIGRFEVTVSQYRMFASETRREMPEEPKWGWEDDHPVVNTSWNDAREFAKWLSKRTREEYRLPTEAEWYFVASEGGKRRIYPWGEGKPAANVADESAARNGATRYWKGYDDGFGFTSPVGSFTSNSLGVYDIGGNAAEWSENYHYSFDDQNIIDPKGPANGKNRVFKGGSFITNEWYSRIAQRNFMPPDFTSEYLGFRVVKKEGAKK